MYPCRFLLPDLQIRAVLDQISPAKVREALTALPEGLEDQFEATIRRIQSQPKERRDLAMKTLTWVAHAFGILDVAALQHAVGIQVGDKNLDHSKLTPLSLLGTSIAHSCQKLVSIQQETSQVRLVHHTLHEYLYNRDTAYSTSEKLIAEVCLTYLLFDAFASSPPPDDESFIEMGKMFPLYRYASQNWGIHAHRLYHENIPPETMELIFRLIFSPSHLERATQDLQTTPENKPLRDGASQDYSKKMMPVHFAAHFGLPRVIRQALDRGQDINAAIESDRLKGWTTLHFVAENRIGDPCGSWMTDFCIESGATCDIQAHDKCETPLHIANSLGRSETSGALIKKNADMELQDIDGWRAIHFAARFGTDETIANLLKSGCEVSPHTGYSQTTPCTWLWGPGKIRASELYCNMGRI